MRANDNEPEGRKDGSNNKVMNRYALTKSLIAKLDQGEAVIGGIGNTNFDLWAAAKERKENFYMLGSMGLACPIALGVALAQPNRRVIALEGDGSLLMQLGALTTIAMLRPRNLGIIVWDNASYQITGGQKTATAGPADIVAIAKGAGIDGAWAGDETDFVRLVSEMLMHREPYLIAARIDNEPARDTTLRDPPVLRERFMSGI